MSWHIFYILIWESLLDTLSKWYICVANYTVFYFLLTFNHGSLVASVWIFFFLTLSSCFLKTEHSLILLLNCFPSERNFTCFYGLLYHFQLNYFWGFFIPHTLIPHVQTIKLYKGYSSFSLQLCKFFSEKS